MCTLSPADAKFSYMAFLRGRHALAVSLAGAQEEGLFPHFKGVHEFFHSPLDTQVAAGPAR